MPLTMPSGMTSTIANSVAQQIRSSPDSMAAQVTREQWQHFLDVYRPVEDEALSRAMQTDFQQEGDEAGQTAVQSVAASAGSLERNLSRSGVTLSSEERSAVNRRKSMTLTKAASSAENTTRRGLNDSRTSLLSSLVGIGRGVANTAAAGLNSAADMAAAREMQHKQQKAATRNSNLSTAATAAALMIAWL